MSQHTPGPWNFFDVQGLICVYAEKPEVQSPICHVNKHHRTTDERNANAKLIASAPYLLEENARLREVLEELLSSDVIAGEDWDTPLEEGRWAATLVKARKALGDKP